MTNIEALQRLYVIAQQQNGCFTAQQALESGFSPQSQHYQVSQGHWKRLSRGIFEITHFPSSDPTGLCVYWLWTCDARGKPQGVFCREAAFALFPYSVWIMREVSMSVPPSFRRRASRPGKELNLYREFVDPADTMRIKGLPVTNLVRTYVDLLTSNFMQLHHLREHMHVALHTGFVAHEDFLTPTLSEREFELLVEFLEWMNYERRDELRQRIQARA